MTIRLRRPKQEEALVKRQQPQSKMLTDSRPKSAGLQRLSAAWCKIQGQGG